MQKIYQQKIYQFYSIVAVGIVVCALILTALLQQPQTIQAATPDQFPTVGTVLSNSNLRGGPGTTYDRVGSAAVGTSVSLTACNAACDWYQLSDGSWIADFLVSIGGAAPSSSASSAASAAPARAAAAPRSVESLPALFRGLILASAFLYEEPDFKSTIVGTAAKEQVVNIAKMSNDNAWYQLDNQTWIEVRLISELPGTRSTVSRPTPPSYQVCDCTADYYNCSNFANPGHAQMCLEYCAIQNAGQRDIHNLDMDNDGLACEEPGNDGGFIVVAPAASAASSSQQSTAPAPAPAATAVPVPTAVPTPVVMVADPNACNCGADAYDCVNFASPQDAQACFWLCGAMGAGDIHKLDLDGNGVVCE